MDNQFNDVELELKDLKPKVREKVMEILHALPEERKADREMAIKAAIEEAENWFMDSEG